MRFSERVPVIMEGATKAGGIGPDIKNMITTDNERYSLLMDKHRADQTEATKTEFDFDYDRFPAF